MRFSLSIITLLCSFSCLAQITSSQQKALNSYVEYANQSADNVTSVVKSIIDYYPTLHQKNSWRAPRYVCPIQLDDYYLNQVTTLNKNLSATLSTGLNTRLKE